MSLAKEFKTFVMRGNVVDLAVGVVIGAAFGKIVTSLVADVVMPPIGLIVGGVNFTDLKVMLKSSSVDAAGAIVPAVTMNVGNFLQTVFDFVIVAAAIFAVVKVINSLQKKKEAEPAAAPAPSKSETLLQEIRDLLARRPV
ncbi:MAG: large-conductance mechanosensitive channel protein MscL [Silvanigrellales bacterium]|jgi:large conductance mechanosensitive channel|nr:large-conductance mechanosensitive channel protein MscL [Silvanigrellales bacterium]